MAEALYLVDSEPDVSPPADTDTATATSEMDVSAEIADARCDLLDLISEDDDAWELFDRQCAEGVAYIYERARQLRNMFEERGNHHELGAVEVAIPELALETHPDSPAATWERLLARVRRDEIIFRNPVTAVQRLATLDSRYFTRLLRLALDPHGPNEDELLALARGMWCDLRQRQQRHESRGFTEHVWAATHALFPAEPGVRLVPEWVADIYNRTLEDLARHTEGLDYEAVDLSGFDAAVEEMRSSEQTGDRRAFLRAARRTVAAGRRAARDAAHRTLED